MISLPYAPLVIPVIAKQYYFVDRESPGTVTQLPHKVVCQATFTHVNVCGAQPTPTSTNWRQFFGVPAPRRRGGDSTTWKHSGLSDSDRSRPAPGESVRGRCKGLARSGGPMQRVPHRDRYRSCCLIGRGGALNCCAQEGLSKDPWLTRDPSRSSGLSRDTEHRPWLRPE